VSSVPAPRGVGILLNPALVGFVESNPGAADYLAIIPDRAWIDRGPGASPRFAPVPAAMDMIEHAAAVRPLVMHSIGMSICSADLFDDEYVEHLAHWRSRYDCLWSSDHLSFTRTGSAHETNAALALPIPYDREVLDLVVPRAALVRRALGVNFLLENNVSYVTFDDAELTEPEFLNTLSRESGCGVLLDLHNLHTNAINQRFDAMEFLGALDLTAVDEVHVAGGSPMMGFHTDSHTGPVLQEVWQLLEAVVDRLPNLRGVTYEFHESSWPLLRTEGVIAQLDRARAILNRRAAPH
jgi:uncharacterized protein (UPF0276 family)